MRVFNTNKTQELMMYDLENGRLVVDTLTKHIPAVKGMEEQGHYETITEYPNGGKDVQWVVDVPAVETVQEHDETEDILVYIPYTETELQRKNLLTERNSIENWLMNHDYVGVKIATGRATIHEYENVIAEMMEKANRINKIDEELMN